MHISSALALLGTFAVSRHFNQTLKCQLSLFELVYCNIQIRNFKLIYSKTVTKIEPDFHQDVFLSSTLNAFMGLTHLHWKETRAQIRSLLTGEDPRLKSDSGLMASAFVNMADSEMLLPAHIGDYTDFYSSLDHATNVGIMFRQVVKTILYASNFYSKVMCRVTVKQSGLQ